MKRMLLLFMVAVLGLGTLSAQIKITGTVRSTAEKGAPLAYATVSADGTLISTQTSANGTYVIEVPKETQILLFSFIGMVTQRVPINGRAVIDVALESSITTLEDVIVVAYGTAKKGSFTGSAEMVRSKDLEKRTISNATKAIEGTVSGVQVTSGGGQPGSPSNIVIRGFGSINASNNPLYVLDGVPYDGSIAAINPSDIESMSVLKDASASALFGARGANGVVMITTKRGAEGDLSANFKATLGVTSRAIPKYNTVNQYDFMELAYESVKNMYIYADGMNPEEAKQAALADYMGIFGGEIYNPFNMSSTSLIDPTTGKVNRSAKLKYNDNWLDEAMRDQPIRQEYQFSLNGGNQQLRFLASIGYLNDQGLAKNTSYERISGRVSVDATVKSWLNGGMSAAYAQGKQNYRTTSGSSYNNIWYSAQLMGPIYPVYVRDATGALVLDANGNKQFDYGETRPYASNFNSIATLYDDRLGNTNDNLSGRGVLNLGSDKEDAGWAKGLKLAINIGMDLYNNTFMQYNNPYHGDAASIGGRTYKETIRQLSYTFNQLLTYNRYFGKHHLDLLAGHEYYSISSSRLYGGKQTMAFGGLYELDAAAVITDAESDTKNYNVESYLSRLNWDFDSKYFLSGSFRTDGSSRFYKDNRWGNFWSVGASWIINKEGFMESIDWINSLSIKASYGAQGNDMLSSWYAWQGLYSLAYPNAGNGGVYLSSLENKDLTWEKNKNLNVGIESRFLDSRLQFSIEWYQKTTSDLLLSRPMATSTGFSSYWDNVGEMKNEGFDIGLSGDVVRTNNIRWNLNLIMSTIKNEVLKLDEEEQIVSGNYITKVGSPVNSFYLTRSAGVDPESGAQLYWAKDREDNEYTTDDYNEAALNRVIMDSRIPEFYGSLRSDLSLYGFDFSIMLTFSKGGKVYDGVYQSLMGTRDPGNQWHEHILKRWQTTGQQTDVPRIELGTVRYATDAGLIDASYVSIKNISLGYNLPQKWMKKIGVRNLKIFAVADNVALFSQLDGMDPQYNFSGGQNFSYTPIRTVSLGIDLKF